MHSSFMPILAGAADECNWISGKAPNGNKMDIFMENILKNGFLSDMILSENYCRKDMFLILR